MMKLARHLLPLAALFGLGTLAAAQDADGTTPSYSFRKAPLNSYGLKSLEDLRGKPVLVEFWGTR